jgi:hypothetical protein
VIETLGLIDFDGIDINQHEHMINVYNNLPKNQYLSYNHKYKMNNEYNSPNIIPCMFPTLFPFVFGLLEMENKVVKISLQLHVKHF